MGGGGERQACNSETAALFSLKKGAIFNYFVNVTWFLPFEFLVSADFIFAYLPHERVESVVNSHACFGRCFDERNIIALRHLQ